MATTKLEVRGDMPGTASGTSILIRTRGCARREEDPRGARMEQKRGVISRKESTGGQQGGEQPSKAYMVDTGHTVPESIPICTVAKRWTAVDVRIAQDLLVFSWARAYNTALSNSPSAIRRYFVCPAKMSFGSPARMSPSAVDFGFPITPILLTALRQAMPPASEVNSLVLSRCIGLTHPPQMHRQ
ncbi:hypothetical protein EXIGLDRAFT_692192 [Exidia glandulosa HHB12029]|uniref:Uncharacterized protein n=1 Tax=Exidia glandulosa HHB12029 TaxID=1314781 RepID=A0A166MM23_EXIGL|nr:hypothetical protein EXIGLDRAFT_692192 [Exidia glandulosa HHB12029]